MRILTLLLVLCSLPATSQAQSLAPTLEERMSKSDFTASGLDNLSPEQLAHLNQWLAANGMEGTASTGSGPRHDFYPDPDERVTIVSHITGAFTGWLGNTVFRLDNGQSWQQAESGRFYSRSMTSPAVTIQPMILGSWLMKVDGCSCSVRVHRVK